MRNRQGTHLTTNNPNRILNQRDKNTDPNRLTFQHEIVSLIFLIYNLICVLFSLLLFEVVILCRKSYSQLDLILLVFAIIHLFEVILYDLICILYITII